MHSIADVEIEKKRQEIQQKLFNSGAASIELNTINGAYSSDFSLEAQPVFLDPEVNFSKFPELVLLNQTSNKPAIFWFHSVGSVQPYLGLAEHTDRPFYGIEARGFRTKRAPLYGVQAIAAYYVQIIMSVQPVGPYDLGGYSLGGLIAYEVTRQLQELGEVVNTIVMIDTLDSSVSEATRNISYKSRLLQGANHTLAANLIQNQEKIPLLLIDRKEVDWTLDEKHIVQHLSCLAIERGAFQSDEEMQIRILRMAELQTAYEYERYTIRPLLRPREPVCYFFRNKNGILFGELSKFFWIAEDEGAVDHLVYWKLWQDNFSKFEIIDIDASTHMTMLTEEKASQPIIKFCKQLYSEQ
ncbi:MAG: hypothetical protein H0U75_00850 [Legionella sp.]|nr:hypothetical protein [Legionella sp.]